MELAHTHTTFADTTYKEAESAFHSKGAQLFADAIKKGFNIIKSNIDILKIDCDYSSKTGYLYAENKDEVKLLSEIYDGAKKVGVAVNYVDHLPTPVTFQKSLSWPGQAQFHPLKYLRGLQLAFLAAGGTILENTRITSVTAENNLHIAESDGRNTKAITIVYATHMPPNINVFNFDCALYRSYVIAVKLKSGAYSDALIYDSKERYHYLHSHIVDDQELLLIGGLDHKTGHEDPEKAFAELEKYALMYYNISSIRYKWSSQHYVPVDGLPYIGKMPFAVAGIYCATGYNGMV